MPATVSKLELGAPLVQHHRAPSPLADPGCGRVRVHRGVAERLADRDALGQAAVAGADLGRPLAGCDGREGTPVRDQPFIVVVATMRGLLDGLRRPRRPLWAPPSG